MEPKKYTFVRDGVEEDVALERWAWGVVYKDGTELHQFDAEGKFHQFREIEQDKVAMFVMYQPGTNKRIDLPLRGNVQIFHVYRHIGLDNWTRKVQVYVFGWKDLDTGAVTYNYILPDDRVLTTNHDIPDLTRYAL